MSGMILMPREPVAYIKSVFSKELGTRADVQATPARTSVSYVIVLHCVLELFPFD